MAFIARMGKTQGIRFSSSPPNAAQSMAQGAVCNGPMPGTAARGVAPPAAGAAAPTGTPSAATGTGPIAADTV
ncbi:hypothetical protein ROTAS13_04527 [Roseomonas sp. TAS13]|nr:hypothetical protein ROTAS13_04527 [Roseomonas sp. TAS13]